MKIGHVIRIIHANGNLSLGNSHSEADHVVAEPFDKVAFVVIDAGSVLIATEPKERHKSAKRKRIHTP